MRRILSWMGWRRLGDPLVLGSLAAFFIALAILATAGSLYGWYQSRPLPSPTAVVDGTVVEVHGPGWFPKGAGSVVIRYGEYSFESARDPGDRFFRQGDVVPVEYSTQHPANGCSLWVADDARGYSKVLRVSALVCGGLGLLSGAVRWRIRRRTGETPVS